MSTSQVTAVLYQLQTIDLELDRVIAEKQSISTSLQGSGTLRKLRAEYDTAQQQLLAGQQAQKDAEWSLEDTGQRLENQERRLYSGSIQNGKELQMLQQEVQHLRAQQSRQEERLLEVMDTAESLKEAAQRKALALQEAEEHWKQENSTLQARREQAEARLQKLQEQRQSLASRIHEAMFKRYETMRRTKQGRAVSKIDENSCQWCRVILTPSEMQQVRISPELQTCTNCGRILYYER
ncbi:zinc ribbon domain-containing protein [Dictyobacter aurantiacus]|uniref:CT398-like coiled coil hairpin domain-containing protein n=1 Tax=Dictyobacter aurantiacus TaxID=1936993 RepID=A0A401ZE61_9CHLR|nr:hypothetical protein [Dictyobacter aurantiacus]GCE04978.1 hypothetical protein KDAU_23070 [Dictyobacter aurantiacus]